MTRLPARASVAAACSMSVDLPMPGSPPTSTALSRRPGRRPARGPARRCRSRRAGVASALPSRPTKATRLPALARLRPGRGGPRARPPRRGCSTRRKRRSARPTWGSRRRRSGRRSGWRALAKDAVTCRSSIWIGPSRRPCVNWSTMALPLCSRSAAAPCQTSLPRNSIAAWSPMRVALAMSCVMAMAVLPRPLARSPRSGRRSLRP